MKRILIIAGVFIIIFIIIIAGILQLKIRSDKQVIILTETDIAGAGVVRSELKTPYKIKRLTKGTFNDTIILNNSLYPPPEINIESITDWYADSITYDFNPYKATKVKLKLTYTFYE